MEMRPPPGSSDPKVRPAVGPTILATLLCLVTGYMAMEALSFSLRPRLAPLLFSSVTFVLALAVLVAEVTDYRRTRRSRRLAAAARQTPDADGEGRLGVATARLTRGELIAFAWFGVLVAAFFFLGFVVGMSAFMVLLMRLYGRESWVLTIGVTSGVMLAVYVMFVRVLGVQVYPGLLGEYVPIAF